MQTSSPHLVFALPFHHFAVDHITARLLAADVQVISGNGRGSNNVFCERLWRSVRFESIYLKQYDKVGALRSGLSAWFDFYGQERPRQGLDYRTPAQKDFVL